MFSHRLKWLSLVIWLSFLAFPSLVSAASNIVTGQQIALDQWGGEIIFMIDSDDDANPLNGPEAVEVTNTQITGKLWSENYGWIRFQHGGAGVSVTVQPYQDSSRGVLSGYAWGEMIGWIDFATDASSGREGVTIDDNGYFQGFAWSESIGWIAFGDVTLRGDRAQTTWRPGTDDDGDLVPDAIEGTEGSDPEVSTSFLDTDNDGVADYVEGGYTSADTNSGDGNPDADGDGFPDYVEMIAGSDEINPLSVPADFDNDGVPDSIEANQGTSPTDPDDYIDTDNDSVPDYIEVYAPNAADKNDDAGKDQVQDSVASHINIEKGTYNSLESGGDCTQIRYLKSTRESDVFDDAGIHFPVGLWDFEIHCGGIGDTANIKIYLDAVYDTTDWKYYKSDGGAYTDMTSIVTFDTESVGGESVTTISFSITDGDVLYDSDGSANGVILDPSGPGTNQPPTDIDLSNNSIEEGEPLATLIGELSTTDPDVHDSHTYSLTCSTPGDDDAHFQIVGNQLWNATVFDTENPVDANSGNNYEICIVTTDEPGETYEENFTIFAIDVFEDQDGDGLTDFEESLIGTSPVQFDTDGDGMSDGCEKRWGFNPLDGSDGNHDDDEDGLSNTQECNGGTDPFTSNKEELEEIRGTNAAGKASVREWCIGKTREECAEFIVGLQNSTRENFGENYARSLEIAQEISAGRSAQKLTYLDGFGHERFAGFIKGKLAKDGFKREAEHLVYRREVVRDVGFHASAHDPTFMPAFTVSNFRDVPTDHEHYTDIVTMNSLGLLKADPNHNYRPGERLKWVDFLRAMLWTRERDVLEFSDLADLPEMDNVRKQNNRESLVYYTAFEAGMVPRAFDPFTPLTRGDVLEFMVGEYQVNLELTEEGQTFRDIGTEHELYNMVQAAHKRSWFDRSNMTRLEPEKDMFRSLFATWFIGSLGAANPFLDTPSFNTVGQKLDRLYDEVYHRETLEERKESAGSLDTGFEDMTDAELALRARKLKEEYRNKLTFEPSRLTLELLDEWEEKLRQERIYKRTDIEN